MKTVEQRKQELISKLRQLELVISKLQQSQKENPGCEWLPRVVGMNNPTDLEASSNGGRK